MRLILVFLASCMPVLGGANEQSLSRISSHMILKDWISAEEEVDLALIQNPNDPSLLYAAVKVYGGKGDEKKVFQTLERIQAFVSYEDVPNDVFEAVSWGIIRNGAKSPTLQTRLMAYLAAALLNDQESVVLLEKSLEDPIDALRQAALSLAGHYRDEPIRQKVLTLLQKDPSFDVRLQAVQAAGQLRLKEAEPFLRQELLSSYSYPERRAAILQSLIQISDETSRDDILTLSKSPNAMLRLLACALVFENLGKIPPQTIAPLLKDTNSDIRQAAIRATVLCGGNLESIRPLLKDRNPQVALTAAWAFTAAGNSAGEPVWLEYLNDRRTKVRRFASAALASSGENGIFLMKRMFSRVQDPFQKVTLAFGLIGHREEVPSASQVIRDFILNHDGPIQWGDEGGFRSLIPFKAAAGAQQLLMPRALVDQMTRLEMIYALHCINPSLATETMRQYLRSHHLASAHPAILLLTEESGDPKELVQPFLNDPDPKVSLQATILYAMWSGEEEGIEKLHLAYPTSPREQKEQILEALGKVASSKSIPFLLEAMQDSHQPLQIIASWSLLRCVYH